jgi:hypothetical protein
MLRFLPALFLLALVSCSKYQPYNYPVPKYPLFEKSHLTRFGSYKLYTAAGEVTVPGLAQQYAGEFSNYFYEVGSVFSDPRFRTFSMVSDDSMVNTSTVPAYEVKRTVVDEYDKFASRWLSIANDTNALNLHIVKYQSHKAVTTSSGYTYYDVEDPVYILKKVGDTLFFPMIRYVIISRGDGRFSFVADKLNNVFSPAGVRKLGSQDTLLVQTFDLAMKRVQ